MKHLVLALRCLLLALLASSAAAQSTPFAVRVLNSSGVESVQTGSSTGSAFTGAATLPSVPGMWQYAFTGGSGSGAAGAPFLTLSAASATLTTAATVTTTLLGQSSSTSASATLGGGGPLVHACWSGGGLMGLRATPGGAVVLGMISPSGPIGITEATGFAAASACPNAWVSAAPVALDPLGGVMYFVCGQAGTAQVVALNTATGAVINTTSISGIGGVITGLALTQTTGALNALALRADAGSGAVTVSAGKLTGLGAGSGNPWSSSWDVPAPTGWTAAGMAGVTFSDSLSWVSASTAATSETVMGANAGAITGGPAGLITALIAINAPLAASPPPSPPPSPRPPPPTTTVFAVYAGVALAGVSEATFALPSVRAAFINATASSLGVAPTSVGITNVASVSATGRRLAQTSLQVDYQVFVSSATASSSLTSKITTTGGVSLTLLQSAMTSVGVTVTGVTLTTPPTQTTIAAPPSPPMPPSPSPSPPPPYGCGVVYQCAAGVSCANLEGCGPCPPGQMGDGRTCAPCSLSVAVISNVAGGSLVRSVEATLSGVASTNTSCTTTGGFVFSWASTALDATGASLTPTATTPSLTLVSRALATQASASFTLSACFAGARTLCATSAPVAFAVTATPLIAVIGGGGGVVGETPVTLSAARSSDPDGAALSTFTFAWSCVRTDGSNPACTARDGTPFAASTTATQMVQLAGEGAGATYTISLTTGTGGRSASTSTVLTVIPGAIPLVAIAGSAVLSGAKANPSQQLVLFANASAFVPGAVTTRWALAAQTGVSAPLLNLADPAVCATALTSVSMVLRAGALTAGVNYVFSLTATDAVGAVGRANATVVTSTPARDGWADVSPQSGVALNTPFVLTASGWAADSDELPLTYSADYFVEGSPAAPVSLTGGSFQDSPVISMQLPAGLPEADNIITLRLTVRSKFGATTSANASVAVSWPVFATAAAVATFVDDATERAAEALQSGDSSSALQVVSGLASLLNVDKSTVTTSSGPTTVEEDEAATAAAAAQRASLLAIVASAVSQSSALVTAPAAIESTAALVSQLVSSSAELSGGGTTSALAVLGTLAGAGAAVSPAAAQSVAAALSNVALAPTSSGSSSSGGGGGGNSSSSANNFVAVLDVLGSLATSQASGLEVAGQAPLTVSTPSIQMSVSLEDPTTSRLLTEPLRAPGSNSSFDALSPAVLAVGGGEPVSATFLSLGFDAHGGDNSNNTGGLTRLAISAGGGGASLEVTNLSTPLTFTLPSTALASNQQASCAWWDDTATPPAYAVDGCVSSPSPHPAGHVVDFIPGFLVDGPASLARAWNISGPLADGCVPVYLDCGNATARASEKLPAGLRGSIACEANSTAVLRGYTGDGCQLRNTTNTSTACFWDASLQSFAGAGCVVPNATRCMCTHLTDFTSSQKISIPMASLSDLVGLNPADLVTKLRTLFIIVIVLFGMMNLGAALGFWLDRGERVGVNEKLCDERCGFRVADDGAWLWRFGLDELEHELSPPTGPAVELAAVFGMPFARLRAALPDEFFTAELTAALGRKHGFSASGMQASTRWHRDLLNKRKRKKRLSTLTSRSLVVPEDVDDDEPTETPKAEEETGELSHEDLLRLEEFIGTALVLAFLQVTQLMPVVQIAKRRAAADAHFADLLSPAGWSFNDTATAFLTLLSPGILNTRDKWWVKARMWKLILSQSPEGYWSPTQTVAFSLEARSTKEVADVQPTLLERIKDQLADFGDMAEDLAHEETDGDRGEATQGREDTRQLGGDLASGEGGTPIERRGSMTSVGGTPRHRRSSMASMSDDEEVSDDPLFCSARAIVASMPRRLASLGPACQTERVWATLCCIGMLQTLNVAWLWGPTSDNGDAYPPQERTIVDAGREWIEALAAEQPALAEAIADGMLAKAGVRTVAKWHRAWERRVTDLRTGEAVTKTMKKSHIHRTSVEMMRAVCTKHETFAVFLSAPLDGMQRWQMWMILMSVICSQLLVNIWMFYAKGVNCCAEVRMLLDCPGVGPCRDVVGNCGDLAGVFADTPVPPYFPDGLKDYTCTTFPDEERPLDSFVVGLISLAIALPVTLFLTSCFEIANDSEAPESWLFYGGITKLMCGLNSHRKWHYTGPAGQPPRFVKWYCRSVDAPKPETIINLWHSFRCWVTGATPPWVEEWQEWQAEQEEEAAAQATHETVPARPSVGGYSSWHLHSGGDATIDGPTIDDLAEGSVHGSVPGSVAGSGSTDASAAALRRSKRMLTAFGLGGIYVTWTIFAWFIFTYGSLIYQLLGPEQQDDFARGWGVSYGMGAAAEWKEIVKEALKGLVILAILERLQLTRPVNWLEEHIDYYSVQALLFQEKELNLWQQTKLFFSYRSRIAD